MKKTHTCEENILALSYIPLNCIHLISKHAAVLPRKDTVVLRSVVSCYICAFMSFETFWEIEYEDLSSSHNV